MRAHALVVAHAFAPASPIGTMRTLRVVRGLDSAGWSQTVLMAAPATYKPSMPIDARLLDRVPSSTEIVHAPVWRPLDRLATVLRGRRGGTSEPQLRSSGNAAVEQRKARASLRATLNDLTSIPDGEIGWLFPALLKGLAAIRRTRPSVIYSTAPPWTGQLVAHGLARISGLPWVADFRDPWARAPWREGWSPAARRWAAVFERAVVARANAVIFATEANHEEYAAHYGADAAQRFFVVPNGCDPSEFIGLERMNPDTDFVIVHAGSLYGARTPEPLIRALAACIDKGLVLRGRVRLRMIGTAVDPRIQSVASALGVGDAVEFVPRMARQQALEEMARASALLVLQPSTTVSIPGKLYEYLALGKPILALCEEGETARLVVRSGLGIAVTTDAAGAIESALVQLLEKARTPLPPAPTELYDGNYGAARIVELLASVSGATTPAEVKSNSSIPQPAAMGAEKWRA